jgi:hypothetical protein
MTDTPHPPRFAQNVVLYAGSSADRQLIQQHEFWYGRPGGPTRFNVLLASYETVLHDKWVAGQRRWNRPAALLPGPCCQLGPGPPPGSCAQRRGGGR